MTATARATYPALAACADQPGMVANRREVIEALDEIDQLRARVHELQESIARKHDYACRMDALAEERLASWNAEKFLADRLASAMHRMYEGYNGDAPAIYTEWEAARRG